MAASLYYPTTQQLPQDSGDIGDLSEEKKASASAMALSPYRRFSIGLDGHVTEMPANEVEFRLVCGRLDRTGSIGLYRVSLGECPEVSRIAAEDMDRALHLGRYAMGVVGTVTRMTSGSEVPQGTLAEFDLFADGRVQSHQRHMTTYGFNSEGQVFLLDDASTPNDAEGTIGRFSITRSGKVLDHSVMESHPIPRETCSIIGRYGVDQDLHFVDLMHSDYMIPERMLKRVTLYRDGSVGEMPTDELDIKRRRSKEDGRYVGTYMYTASGELVPRTEPGAEPDDVLGLLTLREDGEVVTKRLHVSETMPSSRLPSPAMSQTDVCVRRYGVTEDACIVALPSDRPVLSIFHLSCVGDVIEFQPRVCQLCPFGHDLGRFMLTSNLEVVPTESRKVLDLSQMDQPALTGHYAIAASGTAYRLCPVEDSDTFAKRAKTFVRRIFGNKHKSDSGPTGQFIIRDDPPLARFEVTRQFQMVQLCPDATLIRRARDSVVCRFQINRSGSVTNLSLGDLDLTKQTASSYSNSSSKTRTNNNSQRDVTLPVPIRDLAITREYLITSYMNVQSSARSLPLLGRFMLTSNGKATQMPLARPQLAKPQPDMKGKVVARVGFNRFGRLYQMDSEDRTEYIPDALLGKFYVTGCGKVINMTHGLVLYPPLDEAEPVQPGEEVVGRFEVTATGKLRPLTQREGQVGQYEVLKTGLVRRFDTDREIVTFGKVLVTLEVTKDGRVLPIPNHSCANATQAASSDYLCRVRIHTSGAVSPVPPVLKPAGSSRPQLVRSSLQLNVLYPEDPSSSSECEIEVQSTPMYETTIVHEPIKEPDPTFQPDEHTTPTDTSTTPTPLVAPAKTTTTKPNKTMVRPSTPARPTQRTIRPKTPAASDVSAILPSTSTTGTTSSTGSIPDPSTKRITVFLNGDRYFPGVDVSMTAEKPPKSLKHLLSMVSKKVSTGGSSKNLVKMYTPVSGTKICALEQLKPNKYYVAAGNEAFRKVPGGYMNIRYQETIKKRQMSMSWSKESSKMIASGSDSRPVTPADPVPESTIV